MNSILSQGALHPLWMMVLAAAIALVPMILGLLTSYLKVSIVLSMLRNALGAQQVPSSMIIFALSMGLTTFIMGGVLERSVTAFQSVAVSETMTKQPSLQLMARYEPALMPLREFMAQHTSPKELLFLRRLAEQQQSAAQEKGTATVADQSVSTPATAISATEPLRILVPAFVLSELREAFSMGFVVLLPFLVIDLVVSSVLAGLGMSMMSPTMISLPLKLILFVLADGWMLLVQGLVLSYR